VQAVGGVRGELLQALHLADLRWDAHQVAAVQNKVFDRFEPSDGRRQRDDLAVLLGGEFHQRLELLPTVGDRLVDEFEQADPPRRAGVLTLAVEIGRFPSPGAAVWLEAFAAVDDVPVDLWAARPGPEVREHLWPTLLIHSRTVADSWCELGSSGSG
jgi:hypothetical protein